mmetsp:Transcript_107056/g.185974  ORF Transcript_107056/g.185974 Transcript_107056/m.185974 type:complete len:258 (+) Transcript_107056:745-1518(+)
MALGEHACALAQLGVDLGLDCSLRTSIHCLFVPRLKFSSEDACPLGLLGLEGVAMDLCCVNVQAIVPDVFREEGGGHLARILGASINTSQHVSASFINDLGERRAGGMTMSSEVRGWHTLDICQWWQPRHKNFGICQTQINKCLCACGFCIVDWHASSWEDGLKSLVYLARDQKLPALKVSGEVPAGHHCEAVVGVILTLGACHPNRARLHALQQWHTWQRQQPMHVPACKEQIAVLEAQNSLLVPADCISAPLQGS